MASKLHFMVMFFITAVPQTLCFLPESLIEDFDALAKRFGIHYLTVFRKMNEHAASGNDLERLLHHKESFEFLYQMGLCLNILEPQTLTVESKHRLGAIFSPRVNHSYTEMLIEHSHEKSPVFFHLLNESAVPEVFHAIRSIPYKSRVYLILQDSVDARMLRLKEVYHVHEDSSELLVNEIGQRVYKQGVAKWSFDRRSALLRRENLRGSVVRILYPIEMFDGEDRTGLFRGLWSGELYLRAVTTNLNVSLTAVKLYDPELFGPPNSTGDWPGVIGALLRNEADISLASGSPVSFLVPLVNYLASFVNIKFKMYYRKLVTSYSTESMKKTFSVKAWCVSLLFIAILSVGLHLVSNVGPTEEGPPLTISECWLIVYGGLCLKSWKKKPKTACMRFVYISSVFLGFLLNILYVSKLQSSITAKTSSKKLPYEDLQSLADAPEYQVLMYAGHIPQIDAFSSTSGKLKKLADDMRARKDSVITSYLDGMKRVCKEKTILVGFTLACDDIRKSSTCPISSSSRSFYNRRLSLIVRKGFIFKENIDYYIRRGVESGLFHGQFGRYSWDTFVFPKDESTHFAEIEFIHVVPFLLLFGASLVFSSCLLLLELMWFHGLMRFQSWKVFSGKTNKKLIKRRRFKPRLVNKRNKVDIEHFYLDIERKNTVRNKKR